MNILIKLSSLVGLTIAPLIAMNQGEETAAMDDCCGSGKIRHEAPIGENQMKVEKTVMIKNGQTVETCLVDSVTCADWVASGKLAQADCTPVENGMWSIDPVLFNQIMAKHEHHDASPHNVN